MKKSDQKLILLYFLTDMITLNLSVMVIMLLKFGTFWGPNSIRMFVFICNVTWFLTAILCNIYRSHWRYGMWDRFSIHIKSYIEFVSATTIVLIVLQSLPSSRFVIFGVFILFGLLRLLASYGLFKIAVYFRSKGKNKRRVLIVGAGRIGKKVEELIQKNRDLGFYIAGFLDDNHVEDKSRMILGKLLDLKDVLLSVDVDEIIIALPFNTDGKIKQVIQTADYFGVRVRLIPDFDKLLDRTFGISYIGDMPLINIRETPLDDMVNYYSKRLFDLMFSLLAIILFAPVYLAIAILIKLDSPGPIFYSPVRIGINGIHFRLLKFRTMDSNDDEVWGKNSTCVDDPRVTRIGRFLRRSNLDELPQFINVLKGEMSVVGPRPHRLWLTEEMKNEVENYMTRHYLKPGITGWAQINGWRGPTDTYEKKAQRTKHDLWYMENWTFLLDLKIIFSTAFSKKTYTNAI